jgi:DNA replication protein DnaC
MDKKTNITLEELNKNLRYLRMNFLAESLNPLIESLSSKKLSNLEFFEEMIKAQVNEKEDRAQQRRIKNAHLGIIKTLDDFKFHHPSKIDEEKVRYHSRLGFIQRLQNIIIIGTVGLGKTHIAKSYIYQACLAGYTCLSITAAEIIEHLSTAQRKQELEKAIKKYIKPQCLLIDELGFIPMNKQGCDLFFQVISRRHEKSSTIITSNRAYNQWGQIFNNDGIVTSAILDRLLENSDTMVLEGTSYRMRDQKKMAAIIEKNV